MTRILLALVAIVVLGLFIRNALIAAMKDGKPGPRPRKNPNLPPDRLVCGICGEAFDPEQSGWVCPKCKK
jgi:rubrerythrin